MKNATHVIAGALAGLCLVVLAGCNTDPVWAERQAVDGPVTPIDAPEGIVLPDIQVAGAQEVDLVEELLTHRAMYHRMLRQLHDYYESHGREQKRRWAAAELDALGRVRPFKYLLSAEIPAQDLQPIDSIAEADAMYQRGTRLMKEGGHGVPALYREQVMLDALGVFVELIRKYPSSDKIDDAAFWCGEIHKEYLKDQEPLAVRWYERAYTWDPDTPHTARFQAAVTYDFRMHDRARALELYRQVVDLESHNKSNVAFAVRRIHELTLGESDVAGTPTQEMFGYKGDANRDTAPE